MDNDDDEVIRKYGKDAYLNYLRAVLTLCVQQKLGMMCAQTTDFSDNPHIGIGLRNTIEKLEEKLLKNSEDPTADKEFIKEIWRLR